MTEETVTDITEIELPFGRRAILKNVAFEGGLNMLRLTLREGRRFTIMDIDQKGAQDFGEQLVRWAEAQEGT